MSYLVKEETIVNTKSDKPKPDPYLKEEIVVTTRSKNKGGEPKANAVAVEEQKSPVAVAFLSSTDAQIAVASALLVAGVSLNRSEVEEEESKKSETIENAGEEKKPEIKQPGWRFVDSGDKEESEDGSGDKEESEDDSGDKEESEDGSGDKEESEDGTSGSNPPKKEEGETESSEDDAEKEEEN